MGITAHEVIAFFNFIALNTSGGRRFRKDLVYLDSALIADVAAQNFVARGLTRVVDYNVNHAQIVFAHYEHGFPSYQALIGGADILTREYRWDWFQVKYDDVFKLTRACTSSLSSEQYATLLSDVLLNAFLALKNLNDFASIAGSLDETAPNSQSVTHIGVHEINGYELLFNSIFRLRIGWEKFVRLMITFHGGDPGSGFSIILKRFAEILSPHVSAEAAPLLRELDRHARTAVSQIERLRNDEEHNIGVIVRSLGDREYIRELHSRVHAEFKRYQIAVTSGLALLLPP